ncbi:MAG: rRNA maturation RNase YbeY [Desulfobacterales bacterium]|nr:rRNA maturation RNase YbeY [Desulfobacterales bacterium]
MDILISNRQNSQKIRPEKIQKAAEVILNALECHEGELSVVIVNDSEIAELNREYLNREGPTNVIAFPMHDYEVPQVPAREQGEGIPYMLGDVVISVDTARKEGDQAGISMEKRFIELLIHGILHLLGYDHEKDEQEAIIMEEKSNALLEIVIAQMKDHS